MAVLDLRGREHEAAVVQLLAAAQIHRQPQDALARAPAIAAEYAESGALRLWGYELQASIVGIIGVQPSTPGAAIVRDLAVAPDHRHRGIGRALIDFLRTEAGVTELEGDTLEAAAPFYERCGFGVSKDGLMPDGATRYRFVWRAEPP